MTTPEAIKDPEAFAALTSRVLGIELDCVKFKHTEPCGPQRDPGPRDDSGQRWHNCYRITYQGYVVKTGRHNEAVNTLLEIGHYPL